MIAPLLSDCALGARIHAAKIDEDRELTSQWMMVVRLDEQCAVFYTLQSELDPVPGDSLPDPTYAVTRFLVYFSDLQEDPDAEDDGLAFPKFREDLEGNWFQAGKIKVDRRSMVGLIKTVGRFAPKNDSEWTERVILSYSGY